MLIWTFVAVIPSPGIPIGILHVLWLPCCNGEWKGYYEAITEKAIRGSVRTKLKGFFQLQKRWVYTRDTRKNVFWGVYPPKMKTDAFITH